MCTGVCISGMASATTLIIKKQKERCHQRTQKQFETRMEKKNVRPRPSPQRVPFSNTQRRTLDMCTGEYLSGM